MTQFVEYIVTTGYFYITLDVYIEFVKTNFVIVTFNGV